MNTTPLPMFETPPATPSDLLQRASEVLRIGWTQEVGLRDENGKIWKDNSPDMPCSACLWGAIYWGNLCRLDGVYIEASGLLHQIVRNHGLGYINWNDAPGRTQQEVLAKLDEAIVLARHASVGSGGEATV